MTVSAPTDTSDQAAPVEFRIRNKDTGQEYIVHGTGLAAKAPHMTVVWVQKVGEHGVSPWNPAEMMSKYSPVQASPAPAAPVNPLADKTPVELDTRAAELDGDHARVTSALRSTLDRIHDTAEGRPIKRTLAGKCTWRLTDAEATTVTRERLDAGTVLPHEARGLSDRLARAAELETTLAANRAESDLIDAEYARRPWTRFVGVAGGHIHSGIWCKGGTIRYDTIRTWAPELSGLTVADAVAKLGPRLCTHCFPSAPVEWTAAAKVVAHCAGSGRSPMPGTLRRGTPVRGTCQECKTSQTLTSRGLVRAHKTA
jgi:hypothetical protein